MKIHMLITLFILTFSSFISYGQNTIWLTNGKQIKIGEYKIEQPDLIIYKNLKGKSKSINGYEVFSIKEISGSEKIIYSPDTSYQGAFTILEMRSFVQGQYDAGQKFKSPWTTIGGVVVAGASSALINPVFVILVSGAYSSTIGITNTSNKKLDIPTEFVNNENYILGYKKVCKHKRVKNSIIGSVIGLAVGLTTVAIINGN